MEQQKYAIDSTTLSGWSVKDPSHISLQEVIDNASDEALGGYGKHIMVEKPMALTLNGADAMVRACDAAGCKLFVVKQNRYNLPIQKMREALEEGRFGKIVMGTVIVSVASEKYSPVNGLMPLTNMWCPHTIMLRRPTVMRHQTDVR